MDIFGTTAISPFNDPKPVRLTVEGLTDEALFLTSIRGNVTPSYQIMYSIGALRYLNSFSSRMSLFTISGKYVLADCNGPLDSNNNPPFMVFYKKRNINNSDAAIKITFNGIVITGFLVKLAIGNYNQEGIDGYDFQLDFLGIIDGLDKTASRSNGSSSSGFTASHDVEGDITRFSAELEAKISAEGPSGGFTSLDGVTANPNSTTGNDDVRYDPDITQNRRIEDLRRRIEEEGDGYYEVSSQEVDLLTTALRRNRAQPGMTGPARGGETTNSNASDLEEQPVTLSRPAYITGRGMRASLSTSTSRQIPVAQVYTLLENRITNSTPGQP